MTKPIILNFINKLKEKYLNNRIVFKNTAFLGIIQVGNYLLPLLTIPYLVRTLGTEIFGLVSFASSFITYFQIAVDYGFNLSATRELSLSSNDNNKVSLLFYSVLAVKGTILVFSTIIFAILMLTCNRFGANASLYIILFCGVFGSALIPNWLFQGKEEMGFITLFSFIGKIISTGLIFLLIKSSGDYLWFAYLSCFTAWIVGGLSFFIAIKRYNLKSVRLTRVSLVKTFTDGWEIFVSQAAVTLFTNSNIFILGLFANHSTVGMYAVADKIVRAVIYLCSPVCNAIYPKTSVLFSESKERALIFLRQVLLIGSSAFGIISVGLFAFAGFFVEIVSGSKNEQIVVLIRIMSFLPLSVFIDNIYGTQIMLNINLKKQFMRIILSGGLCSLIVLFVLVPYVKAIGSAIAFTFSELVILVSMVITVRNAGVKLMTK